jgi:hypothetical protein
MSCMVVHRYESTTPTSFKLLRHSIDSSYFFLSHFLHYSLIFFSLFRVLGMQIVSYLTYSNYQRIYKINGIHSFLSDIINFRRTKNSYAIRMNRNETQQIPHRNNIVRVNVFIIHNDLKILPNIFRLKAHLTLKMLALFLKEKST